ncbi:hypothetical protein GCM10025734_24280 [Kitasatospora paranensis]
MRGGAKGGAGGGAKGRRPAVGRVPELLSKRFNVAPRLGQRKLSHKGLHELHSSGLDDDTGRASGSGHRSGRPKNRSGPARTLSRPPPGQAAGRLTASGITANFEALRSTTS